MIPLLVFLVLITNKLDRTVEMKYFAACAPLFLTFFTLMIASFGARGGKLPKIGHISCITPLGWSINLECFQGTNIGLDFASRLVSFYLAYVHACNCLVTFHTVFIPIKETAIGKLNSYTDLRSLIGKFDCGYPTVLTFSNFLAALILCEINISWFQNVRNFCLYNLKDLNFDI